MYSRVAQWLAQRFLIPPVVGSSPASGVIPVSSNGRTAAFGAAYECSIRSTGTISVMACW
jgi:hypothetical protein